MHRDRNRHADVAASPLHQFRNQCRPNRAAFAYHRGHGKIQEPRIKANKHHPKTKVSKNQKRQQNGNNNVDDDDDDDDDNYTMAMMTTTMTTTTMVMICDGEDEDEVEHEDDEDDEDGDSIYSLPTLIININRGKYAPSDKTLLISAGRSLITKQECFDGNASSLRHHWYCGFGLRTYSNFDHTCVEQHDLSHS